MVKSTVASPRPRFDERQSVLGLRLVLLVKSSCFDLFDTWVELQKQKLHDPLWIAQWVVRVLSISHYSVDVHPCGMNLVSERSFTLNRPFSNISETFLCWRIGLLHHPSMYLYDSSLRSKSMNQCSSTWICWTSHNSSISSLFCQGL